MKWLATLNSALIVGCIIADQAPGRQAGAAPGPLRVHPTNPRYFTDGTKTPDDTWKAVYLTGSHIWNILQDPDPAKSPAFDYGAYLELLQRHNHNFFRMWTRMGTGGGPTPAPTIYARTGPGRAKDGGPKYDLSRFNEVFFQRLRARAKAAGERGIYVAVMFFGGDNVEFREGNPNEFQSSKRVSDGLRAEY